MPAPTANTYPVVIIEHVCGHRSEPEPEIGRYRVAMAPGLCAACRRLRGIQETWRESWSDVMPEHRER